MKLDTIKLDNVVKPTGNIHCVYFSTNTKNTETFVKKLGFNSTAIPYEIEESIELNFDYVLFCPTYSGGGEFTSGAVPKQVIKFLNNEKNRSHCRGVVASGNTNFNNTFALAGSVLTSKLKVPLLYQYELRGTPSDVERLQKILKNFWGINE
ncbi:class Ib ribonucleoside-diphosphate reductase assembly flavoprotein NrdI [Mycoplasma sp. CSL10137]|uniref:class Ib ribonucleoside-diphosphate reductase assembly flavoprotein NrdI n=1 Tax=unclassified Mycoplasma TaxID=2683645 RepID=UPI00197BC29B|nr:MULTISPECIES: class Ib ribonucleoside-diphosphate reductase assembly flavoprotein NrdI [unclassified Mycoplasma]MBN4083353.1 class Ib ribonucleoside-diphosphate reductase assembly flavoprotein NrdI [Mycoplasma sp. CSL10137]MBN4084345.1 class Ib ribonucleoside-diphosphate reductase assembly flavoprotein NrdI [Mycoplasma sp. CSL10166]MBU4692831.1 class Ib ribonucleoside-diphosphate reductase assembly flavoprotein NrdI [Mycoplasma sp. CSL7491-lung]